MEGHRIPGCTSLIPGIRVELRILKWRTLFLLTKKGQKGMAIHLSASQGMPGQGLDC